jgi:hypothetical protein
VSLLLALALQAAAAESAPQEEQEILVIAQKLKNWRGVWKPNKDNYTCKTKRSTGDKEIDQIGCDAMLVCARKYGPELQAISDSSKNKKEFAERSKPISDEFGRCTFDAREKGVAALADRRAEERK